MASAKTINCADCGHETQAKRANMKYCRVCRLYRDICFVGERKKTCPACSKEYAPISRNSLVCGSCDPTLRQGRLQGTCGLCNTTHGLYSDDVLVCGGCLCDPSKRSTLVGSLAQKQSERLTGVTA